MSTLTTLRHELADLERKLVMARRSAASLRRQSPTAASISADTVARLEFYQTRLLAEISAAEAVAVTP